MQSLFVCRPASVLRRRWSSAFTMASVVENLKEEEGTEEEWTGFCQLGVSIRKGGGG